MEKKKRKEDFIILSKIRWEEVFIRIVCFIFGLMALILALTASQPFNHRATENNVEGATVVIAFCFGVIGLITMLSVVIFLRDEDIYERFKVRGTRLKKSEYGEVENGT